MPRIVHLGFGNFHRAHQAWYTQRANGITGSDWRITGVSMTRPDLRDALAPDGFAYTLAERGTEGLKTSRITVHDRVLVAAEDPRAVVAEIADPDTQIVTLTVTEKGYYLGADGALDLDTSVIAEDLVSGTPRTAIGLLAHGLAARAEHGAPLTILSCDNLSENGQKTARAIAAFARAAGMNITAYLSDNVSFPDSMVDRITPATTDAIREEIADATGMTEPSPILTEAFSDWVITDNFATPHPDWAVAGAVLTPDVEAYEARKLLMLNAAHSTLTYAGLLRGHAFVHEASADTELRAFMETLWDEAAVAIPAALHDTLADYRSALSERFSIPEMQHRLDQIAMDGSLKVAVRLVPILRANHAAKRPCPATQSAIGAWIAYLWRFSEHDAVAADPQVTSLLEKRQSASFDVFAKAALSLLGADIKNGPQEDILRAASDWLDRTA